MSVRLFRDNAFNMAAHCQSEFNHPVGLCQQNHYKFTYSQAQNSRTSYIIYYLIIGEFLLYSNAPNTPQNSIVYIANKIRS